jgi:predicted nucleotidyltransferase
LFLVVPIFDQLSRAAAERGLKFLVIGGHAVMRHGFMRATEDVDILVSREERPRWEALARGLGYEIFHDGETFLQLTPAGGKGWELDLMLAPAPTVERMLADARPAQIEGATVLVPSLEHLFALKFHALQHASGLRMVKDLEDVIQLVRVNRVDVGAASFRQLVEKYGTADLYERVVRACAE